MKNTFRMTAIATAIAAITACSDSNDKSAAANNEYKNPNANVASAVFNASSYTPITSQDRDGTWILSSRYSETYTYKEVEPENRRARVINEPEEPTPLKTEEFKGRLDGGTLNMGTMRDDNEGGYNLNTVCGDGPSLHLAPLANGSFGFSTFNEDGSCDDNDNCESYNITFTGNTLAKIEHKLRNFELDL